MVAFSGGADSALLAWVAHDVLGEHALAVTAVSPSLPADERDACRDLAEQWGMAWHEVVTHELDDPRYTRNDGDRCFWCKDALLDRARAAGHRARCHRLPGCPRSTTSTTTARARTPPPSEGAVFPLVDAGFTKDRVREVSRDLGLVTWDKPAAACLASRLPYGTAVTLGRLASVERAEAALRALGFADLRVRHHGEVARIEVPELDLDAVVAKREAVVEAVTAAGYRWVTLDLAGLRSGGFNQLLG